MAFGDVASKIKGKGKGGKDMSGEDAIGKFKDENPLPKGKGKPSKKGGFKEAVKNAKKKCKGKKC